MPRRRLRPPLWKRMAARWRWALFVAALMMLSVFVTYSTPPRHPNLQAPDNDQPTEAVACTSAQLTAMLTVDSFFRTKCLLAFPEVVNPRVSVIVIAHNRAQETYNMLRSLLQQSLLLPFEVVLVDDASNDLTYFLFAATRGTRVVHFDKLHRVALATNIAVFNHTSPGADYLLLLNNDMELSSPLAIGLLVSLLREHPEVGAAGAKIIQMDHKLLEAGALIWRDGKAISYGRGDKYDLPMYNFVRQVDYCSAACLLIRRELFVRLGGLDADAFPWYYSDADLQMKIQHTAHRSILYQPLSVARRLEFGSFSKTDEVRLMNEAQQVFVGKWTRELAENHYAASDAQLHCASNRLRPGRLRLLWVDHAIPTSVNVLRWQRSTSLLLTLRRLGHFVSILPFIDKTYPLYAATLEQHGFEVNSSPSLASEAPVFVPGRAGSNHEQSPSLVRFLQARGEQFDAIIISTTPVLQRTFDVIRKLVPHAFIIADVEALLWQAQDRTDSFSSQQQAKELDQISKCQQAWLTTPLDVNNLRLPSRTSTDLRLIRYAKDGRSVSQTPFLDRRVLGFWADFTGTLPDNADAAAMEVFLQQIWPQLLRDLPSVRFHIGYNAGSVPLHLAEVIEASSNCMAVSDAQLDKFLSTVRVLVVPHTYGSGLLPRILDALAAGVPVVAMRKWGEALEIEGEVQGMQLVSDMEELIDAILRTWTDEQRWTTMHTAAHEEVKRRFAQQDFDRDVQEALQQVPRKSCVPLVSEMVEE